MAEIHKNHVYRLMVNNKSRLVALRGSYNNGISMDEVTREKLGIQANRSYHFDFYKTTWIGQFLWAWGATDPAYRIATRLGALSLVLGIVGTILGVWSLYLTLR
jgi:hypothetical protein